jgi:hypothetical protein
LEKGQGWSWFFVLLHSIAIGFFARHSLSIFKYTHKGNQISLNYKPIRN